MDKVILILDAGHTNSGCPRRLYVLAYTKGAYIQAWEDNYSSYKSVPDEYQEMAQRAIYVETTTKYYNQIKREYVKK